MNCKTCPLYKCCSSLCSDAIAYINQDADPKSWRKIRPTDQIERIQTTKMPDNLSTTEIILQFYFIDRMEVREISNRLFKSRQYIHKVIKKYSNILKQNIQKSV